MDQDDFSRELDWRTINWSNDIGSFNLISHNKNSYKYKQMRLKFEQFWNFDAENVIEGIVLFENNSF